jgi:D-3-phosphoglycerate dehydrogenase
MTRTRPKILISESISEEGIEKLKREADVDFLLEKEELIDKIVDYDALIIRSQTKVMSRVIEACKKLKIIARAGIGVDNIDVDAATEKGILVVNAPDATTISAAEHTIALLLSMARKIPQANASLRRGRWERSAYIGVEVNDKVLGIIGLGRIGTEVARRAQALGMRILAYDPFISPDSVKDIGIEFLRMEEVFSRADYITLHVPLTNETRHLIGVKEFELMQRGVMIINCARGGIIDEEALVHAIENGRIAGAALDVFENEPPYESKLLSLDEVIVTPHLGASTEEAQVNVARSIADDVLRAIRDEAVSNAINMPPIQDFSDVKPYLSLAEKLGSFCGQLISGHLESAEICYHGEIAEKETDLLTIAMLKGLLSLFVSNINFVNATLIARNRGLRIIESKTESAENFTSLISVRISTDREQEDVAGTLFGKDDTRIVRIDGYRVDAVPSGYMLISKYIDKPKVIGPVGVILGENGINIAGMQVGREKIGGEAVMVLNVDDRVDEEIMEEVRRVDGIIDVKLVTL